jgi:circadian clock protein KaiC
MKKVSPKPISVPRVSSGSAGLDDILSGGLPSGHMYLLEGEPGTGKTTLAMKFLLRGAEAGHTVLYVTLSETESGLRNSAATHGWETSKMPILELVPEDASTTEPSEYTVFYPTEVELSNTVRRILEEVERVNPTMVAVDSVSELRLLSGDSIRYRRQLLAIKQFFSQRSTTVIFLDDRSAGPDDMQLHSIAHGVIRLSKLPREYGVTRRHLEVLKLRGSSFREGFHDYVIEQGGLHVFPRLVASEHDSEFSEEMVSSGLPGLDELLGGGLTPGTSTLVTGPSGIGKSSLVLQFVVHQAMAGRKAVYYTFDEVSRLIKLRAAGLSIQAEEAIASGRMKIEQIDPAELSPGEFTHRIRNEVNNGVSVLAIDSVNGLMSSMPGEHEVALQLHELLSYLNQKGVVTFLVLTMAGLIGNMQTKIDVSYLSDNILLLRYFEARGEVRQALSVLKKRTGNHERTIRELNMGGSSLDISEPITRFHGVLSGVPAILGGPEPHDLGAVEIKVDTTHAQEAASN